MIPTKEFYDKSNAFGKGYLCYLYAMHPKSKIPKTNPFTPGTKEFERFCDGEQAAMLVAQDSEE